MYRLIVCLVLIGSCFILKAQDEQSKSDSLALKIDRALVAYEAYDYPTALQEVIRVLEKADKNEDLYYIFQAYNLMGYVQNASKDFSKSIISQEKALAVAKRSGADSLISWALNDLGNIYSESSNDYEKGISYYLQALEVNRKGNTKEEEDLVPLMNIGWTYLDHNDYEKAYPYISKARMYANRTRQSPILHANLDVLFGRYYLLNGNYNIAERELTKVLISAEENNFLDQASDASKNLAVLYEKQNKYDKALELTRKNALLEKKIYDLNKIKELEEASAKFEVQQYKKETELAKMEQQYASRSLKSSKSILIASAIAGFLLLGTLLILWRQFTLRKKAARDLKEKNDELIIAKNEAERLSNLKTQFFSTVSHELRTPLYGITGIASILLEDKNITSHRDDLESLKFSADYLMTLINDVLVLNKIDANGIRLENAPFNLRNLVKGIVKSFEFLKQQNKNKLHVEIDSKIPTQLSGDSIRLSQILLNLVGNAIKFNENTNVWVCVSLSDHIKDHKASLEFSIKDDGIGISPLDQETIFDEFKQANNKNYSYQGTGLGLPIVKKLVTLFGGVILLESALDKGAVFTFTITLDVPENQALPKDDKGLEKIEAELPENLHVLVVDDNLINQKITRKVLENKQFRCTIAHDGQQALDLAKANTYDLILMDINMPVMNGIDATKAIRAFNTKTPIIALTAVEVEQMRVTILEAGMNDIILKPYDMLDFHSIILRNIQRVESIS